VVRATSYDAISLELSGDRTVLWGSAEDSAAKAAALLAAMEAAGDARHFDVSAPSAPAVAEG
jgi:cell division protein FtsQ